MITMLRTSSASSRATGTRMQHQRRRRRQQQWQQQQHQQQLQQQHQQQQRNANRAASPALRRGLVSVMGMRFRGGGGSPPAIRDGISKVTESFRGRKIIPCRPTHGEGSSLERARTGPFGSSPPPPCRCDKHYCCNLKESECFCSCSRVAFCCGHLRTVLANTIASAPRAPLPRIGIVKQRLPLPCFASACTPLLSACASLGVYGRRAQGRFFDEQQGNDSEWACFVSFMIYCSLTKCIASDCCAACSCVTALPTEQPPWPSIPIALPLAGGLPGRHGAHRQG